MLNTMGQLLETQVIADDGVQGHVLDAYFDEHTWEIRYLLIEIDGPAPASQVLFPAWAMRDVDPDGSLRVGCLSRESALYEDVDGMRSSRLVMGCDVAAWTGALGTAQDAVIEMDSWRLLFLVVDAQDWCPGGVVLVQLELVENAKWEERMLDVAVTHLEVFPASSEEDDDELMAVCLGADEALH